MYADHLRGDRHMVLAIVGFYFRLLLPKAPHPWMYVSKVRTFHSSVGQKVLDIHVNRVPAHTSQQPFFPDELRGSLPIMWNKMGPCWPWGGNIGAQYQILSSTSVVKVHSSGIYARHGDSAMGISYRSHVVHYVTAKKKKKKKQLSKFQPQAKGGMTLHLHCDILSNHGEGKYIRLLGACTADWQ